MRPLVSMRYGEKNTGEKALMRFSVKDCLFLYPTEEKIGAVTSVARRHPVEGINRQPRAAYQ
jgi:hypothetical protein